MACAVLRDSRWSLKADVVQVGKRGGGQRCTGGNRLHGIPSHPTQASPGAFNQRGLGVSSLDRSRRSALWLGASSRPTLTLNSVAGGVHMIHPRLSCVLSSLFGAQFSILNSPAHAGDTIHTHHRVVSESDRTNPMTSMVALPAVRCSTTSWGAPAGWVFVLLGKLDLQRHRLVAFSLRRSVGFSAVA